MKPEFRYRGIALCVGVLSCTPSNGDAPSVCTDATSSVASGEPTSGPTSGDTAGACVGPEYLGDCCCYPFSTGLDLAGCVADSERACPEIVMSCPYDDVELCSADELVIDCEVHLDCALRFLSEGEPGFVRWRIESSEIPGYSSVDAGLFLAGDGMVHEVRRHEGDVDSVANYASKYSLRSASYFAGCMDAPVAEKVACLTNAFLAPELVRCDPSSADETGASTTAESGGTG